MKKLISVVAMLFVLSFVPGSMSSALTINGIDVTDGVFINPSFSGTSTFSGNVGIGTTEPAKKLDIVGNGINLEDTTTDSTGIVFKNGISFIHNFQHPLGDTAVPAGYNTFIGINAGNFTMGSTATETYHGSNNTAMGYASLRSNTTGYANTANGYRSLYANTTGYANTANGYDSLRFNTIGHCNTANGYRSLYANTTGYHNTANGYYSLRSNTTGYANTANGYDSLYDLTEGIQNTAFGYNTGRGITTGDYNTIIGANVTGLDANLSNNIIIADGEGNQRINVDNIGNVGIGTTSPGYKLEVLGDIYASGDVSALTFTDRTPWFSGDALAAIKNIKGVNGEVDHSSLPEFAQGTIKQYHKETVLGPRVPVDPANAWEEYTVTETTKVKDAKGDPIIEKIETVYKAEDGKITSKEKPVYQTTETQISKKRLKEGIKVDEKTGELYTQESTVQKTVIAETPGRDLGAMISVLTRAVQQLTERIEALEAP
jgi:hypothetical protein